MPDHPAVIFSLHSFRIFIACLGTAGSYELFICFFEYVELNGMLEY